MNLRVVFVTQGLTRVLQPLHEFLGHDLIAVIESAPRSYKLEKWSLGRFFRNGLSKYAQKNGIAYFFLHKANQRECIDWLKTISPDLVVVYSMSQLLSPEFLAVSRYGCINLHPSILPKYRGPNPCFWSYYNQDAESGVTLHYLDPGEDTGPIIDQRTYEVPLGIKSPAMQDLAIGRLGVEMILDTLKKLKNGDLVASYPQPVDSPTARARNIKLSEHSHIINWAEWPIERIWHVMRGTELWLNCIDQPSGLIKGLRWSIDGFEKTDLYCADCKLWGKLSTDKVGKYVICRDGLIRIHADLRINTLVKAALKRLYCKLAGW